MKLSKRYKTLGGIAMVFNLEEYKKFKNKTPEEVLYKYIYDYRDNVYNADYHFIVGLALLKMGYLQEANIAFGKAIENNGSCMRNHVFYIASLVEAQKYDEAIKYLQKIDIKKLNLSEIVVVLEIKKRLDLPNYKELKYAEKLANENNTDDLILMVFAYSFAKEKENAQQEITRIRPEQIKDFETFIYVVKEFYKLHNIDKAFIYSFINRFDLKRIREKDFVSYLKMLFGVRYYQSLPKEDRENFTKTIYRKFGRNEEILSQINAMNYDIAELENNLFEKKKIISNFNKINNKKKDIEQVLLYLVMDSFRDFNSTNKKALKKRIEKLISLNQENIKYRKYYFEFLRHLGLIQQARMISEATLEIKKQKEKREFELIRKFHDYYDAQFCLFYDNPKHEQEVCPLCFGSGYKPIIKTIAFGHSPQEIFTDNMEKRIIEVDEKTLKEIVDWQPMNIPSPIVGSYLRSLGAYSTSHDFPDVLVQGQTYVFLKLKTEAYERLAKEGYSLEQIDPLAKVFMGVNKINFAKGNKIFSQEDKKLESNIVSADDFVLEIIHAIGK